MSRTPALPDSPSFRASSFRRHVWRYRVLMESTFGMSILESWEKLVFLLVLLLLASLFATGCVRYLPLQFVGMQHRFAYYLWGSEDSMHAA